VGWDDELRPLCYVNVCMILTALGFRDIERIIRYHCIVWSLAGSMSRLEVVAKSRRPV
jgi:hypothetical protein